MASQTPATAQDFFVKDATWSWSSQPSIAWLRLKEDSVSSPKGTILPASQALHTRFPSGSRNKRFNTVTTLVAAAGMGASFTGFLDPVTNMTIAMGIDAGLWSLYAKNLLFARSGMDGGKVDKSLFDVYAVDGNTAHTTKWAYRYSTEHDPLELDMKNSNEYLCADVEVHAALTKYMKSVPVAPDETVMSTVTMFMEQWKKVRGALNAVKGSVNAEDVPQLTHAQGVLADLKEKVLTDLERASDTTDNDLAHVLDALDK